MTVCPTKNSNTALYHDLVKASNESKGNRETLKRAAYEIFVEKTNKKYEKQMLAISNKGNMDQVLQGFHSLPTPYNYGNRLKIKMWNLNGTISTPWFGEDYVEEYYKEDREFLMVLELPEDIKDQVGSGSLIVELEVDTREETGWFEEVALTPNFTLHTTVKKWTEAESICQTQGLLGALGFEPSAPSSYLRSYF